MNQVNMKLQRKKLSFYKTLPVKMSQVVHKASFLSSALRALKYVPNFKLTDLQLVVRAASWYIFTPKITILGKFWRALEWKMLVYFMPIWNILRAFGICYGHLVILWHFCIYFPHFGTLCRDKSGNPACCRFLQINFSCNESLSSSNKGTHVWSMPANNAPTQVGMMSRVARWYIFIPELPSWVLLGRSSNGKCCIFYGHLENFTDVWYILRPFGIYLRPFGIFLRPFGIF
jgi:hypothetical protein